MILLDGSETAPVRSATSQPRRNPRLTAQVLYPYLICIAVAAGDAAVVVAAARPGDVAATAKWALNPVDKREL